MASLFHFSPIISSLFLITSCYALNQTPKPYIVYMGSPLNNSGDSAEIAELSHLRMLSSIIPSEESERISVRHSYHHAYRGFCALLTEDEATLLSGHEEVVSVFPDPVLQLHTTRSWNFLGLGSSYYSRSSSYRYNHGSSYDIIIGVIDTGIWPESPSFDDQHIGKVPSRWKGVCMEGFDFDKSNCNRKLIGARFYKIEDQESSFTKIPNITTKPSKPNGTPRDKVGHGTNTASIAAGAIVPNANYYGLANGTARGGLPSARIATYKACSEGNCQGSAILKAIDDAIKDGVDIISISIGRSFVFQTDFKDDPIAIGALHAAEKGVMVVCSGGNEGPDPYTVTNSAPWIFTVAASTIDRKFQSTIVLGNNVSLKGSGISYNPTGRSRSRTYPLAFGENIPFHPSLTSQARNCMPGSLDAKRVTGKIIVCMNDDWTISREIKKLVVQDAKAKGLILIDEAEKSSPFDSGNFPFTEVGKLAGAQILQYINSSQNPLATIFPANEIRRFKPAPVVADFSSRGPATLTENILKPDISAPGVGILSAMIPIVDEVSSNLLPEKKSSSLFGITSGTSMACPHVTGAMAFIKSIHPTWSFSMIKSAIMTTATISNNLRKHLTNTSAQACASRVIAVEASEKMAAVAAQIAKDNNILRTGSENEGSDPSNGVMEVVQGMVEELQSTQKVQPHSVDVLVSEWMGYCLLYESMLSSVLYARDQFLKPGGAVLPDMATMFVAGFGRGGTSIPFWENVYGFNMSCIGEEIVKDASRIPIVDVIDSCDIITNSTVLQNFDLVTMKLEEMDFTAKVELELKGKTLSIRSYLHSHNSNPATPRWSNPSVSFYGSGISYNPTGRSRSRTYPLAFGENIPFHPSLTSQARNCMPGSLDAKRVTGKIIVCMNDDWTISREIKKLVVQDAKAKGLILIDEAEKSSPFDSGNFPFTEVGKLAGAQILQYINSSQNPLATIFPANEIRSFKPAPVVADFSSRGPATLTENILKPDISAPGVGILSAMIPIVDEVSSNLLPEKKSSSLFGITSGTSMACPHVTGAMAFIKSIHPTWSFSMIKSAIMTTATISNNLRKHLTNTSGLYSNPHEIGAGELRPIKALDPGLVFETTMNDYYNFLCYYGYKENELRLVASKNYKNFGCPRNASTSKKELISNINYPSISIEKLKKNEGVVKVKRVATNVGSDRNSTYTCSTIAPPAGLVVRVSPRKIAFVKGIKKASFEVSFDGKKALKGYNFGIITWSDGSHKVQMVFAVNIE